MKIFVAAFCLIYVLFFSLLYFGVIHFEVQEKSFLVVAGLLTMLFCFSILALIFIARAWLLKDTSDNEPLQAEEKLMEIQEELDEDQPEQFTDEQVLEPNIDLRIQEHRHPTIARIAANRGGPANKKYMNSPTR